ncbi:lipocalin family protein [Prosthecobacter algae]|uniref:Lipocalin family protein n=1 Tax=Prosthecobacter algae TaxID=1144682 RepID=A0ABP9NYF5_9BACT
MKTFYYLLAAACLFSFTSCSTAVKQPPLKTVAHVDLPRYMGDWYVFAHIPYSLEKGKVGTLDRYTPRPDGKMDNIFLFRKGSLDAPLQQWKGKAWVHNKETNAEWRVQLLWPFRIPYLIIDLDPDYQWSVIGYPNRKLAWVLSRKPSLDEATYQGILKRLEAQGYDRAKLVKVPQNLH